MAKMKACSPAIRMASNKKIATPAGSRNQDTHWSPTSTPSSPPMNAISRWPASRFAHSRTVSEIRRRKFDMISIGKISPTIGPFTPPGIRLFTYPIGPWCLTPSYVKSTNTPSARISGKATFVSAAKICSEGMCAPNTLNVSPELTGSGM